MPFAQKFDPVYRTITEVLEGELHLTCTRTDELLGGGHIIEDILRGIGECEIVVVDVTGRNPNVFYELGIAHMCKDVDKVILLSQEVDSIPFDLRQFRHIIYRPTLVGLRALRTSLKEAAIAVGQRVHRIVLDDSGRGSLLDRLMGKDHCLYQFEVLESAVGYNAAKLLLQVTRHVIGQPQKVVFKKGIGLTLGELRQIPETEWAVSLERFAGEKPWFRISPAIDGEAGDRRPATRRSSTKSKPRNAQS